MIDALRSSAVLGDGRHSSVVGSGSGSDVALRSSAVLGDGRHSAPWTRSARTWSSCDPRPSWGTAATLSVTTIPCEVEELRSSAVLGDGRHVVRDDDPLRGRGVAILGRPGGRPPPEYPAAERARDEGVAILGRPGGRPPPPGQGRPGRFNIRLRSSAVLGDGRHSSATNNRSTPDRLRSSAVLGDGRHPAPWTRSARTWSSCDPRPSWGTAATLSVTTIPCEVEELRSSAVLGDGRHQDHRQQRADTLKVAILGRPGGRPPRRRNWGSCSWCWAEHSSGGRKGDKLSSFASEPAGVGV